MFGEFFRIRLAVRTLRKLAVTVEREAQPVGVVLEFRPVPVGEVREIESRFVPVVVKGVQREFGAELPVRLAQTGKVEMVEYRRRIFTRDVGEKEDVVVDEEVVILAVRQWFEHIVFTLCSANFRSFVFLSPNIHRRRAFSTPCQGECGKIFQPAGLKSSATAGML